MGMGNTYLSLGWCFLGVLEDFHKYLECVSRSFYESFQKDSNVCASCFEGVLGCFLSKNGLLCIRKPWQLPMQTQLDRKTLRTPLAHPLHTEESH